MTAKEAAASVFKRCTFELEEAQASEDVARIDIAHRNVAQAMGAWGRACREEPAVQTCATPYESYLAAH